MEPRFEDMQIGNQPLSSFIASIAHEANRAYCLAIGDDSQPHWENAATWQADSAINGVLFRVENPDAGPSAMHDSWLRQKQSEGWKYGEVKDAEAKTHPCCVPYDELPYEQRLKDRIFSGIVDALIHVQRSN